MLFHPLICHYGSHGKRTAVRIVSSPSFALQSVFFCRPVEHCRVPSFPAADLSRSRGKLERADDLSWLNSWIDIQTLAPPAKAIHICGDLPYAPMNAFCVVHDGGACFPDNAQHKFGLKKIQHLAMMSKIRTGKTWQCLGF